MHYILVGAYTYIILHYTFIINYIPIYYTSILKLIGNFYLQLLSLLQHFYGHIHHNTNKVVNYIDVYFKFLNYSHC